MSVIHFQHGCVSFGSSPPMVVSWNSSNCPLTKRRTKLDLPTAMSPSSTSLNWQILVWGRFPLVLVVVRVVMVEEEWWGCGVGWGSS